MSVLLVIGFLFVCGAVGLAASEIVAAINGLRETVHDDLREITDGLGTIDLKLPEPGRALDVHVVNGSGIGHARNVRVH